MEKQADIDRHIAFEQQWHKEDKQFITFARNVIEKKKVAGDPILPLLKVVKVSDIKNLFLLICIINNYFNFRIIKIKIIYA